MADETPTPKAKSNTLGDVAAILREYVPKSEHAELLDAYNTATTKLESLSKQYEGVNPKKLNERIAELEGKVRTTSYRDAYKGLVTELNINPDFADEVFELAKLTIDQDEPDLKQMKSVLKDFLDLKPKFVKLPDAETTETPAPTKPGKLQAEETGRGSQSIGGKFRYNGSNLSDPNWMAKNGVAYSEAAQNGQLARIGD